MRRWPTIALACVALAGCDAERPAGEGGEPEADAAVRRAADQREVVAWVNDQPVYEAEIDFFLETRLNLLPFQRRDPELRAKTVESLIASRAMAQEAERELSDRERRKLDMETAFFREEQLTKRYLVTNAQPEPVTQEMVREYYEGHLEEFGQRTLKEIEWLATAEGLGSEAREALLPQFQQLDEASDWQGSARRINRDGIRVDYKRGSFASDLLDPRLAAVVESTAVDDTSGLHMIDGRLHRIRVLAETRQAAQPLGKVSGEIRKRLAPLAMRESVQRASDAVTAQLEVRYPETASIE